MLKKLLLPVILLIVIYFVTTIEQLKIIIAGVAIFLLGMGFMEDGFKYFSGGVFEKIIEKFTNNTPKAITTGFVLTTLVQSSSLISIIIISFLSAELIGLTQAIAVIFGSNIGSTTTAWIISSFGLKIKIAAYALPLIIIGVILKFAKKETHKGLGLVFIGLGLIFLGIDYMIQGFETLKDAIDLSKYSIEGYLGILIYILVGLIATVVIQSSGATMALVITALISGHIIYINALALAIGSNLGTTITAILGSLTSNENGKRLALAHLIFNTVTAIVAVIFIYQLSDLVDLLSPMFGISDDNYGMKLALFHTVFNILGVILMVPFLKKLTIYLQKLFKKKPKKINTKYIDIEATEASSGAKVSLRKELENLYSLVENTLLRALSVNISNAKKAEDLKEYIASSRTLNKLNLDEYYEENIKPLYGEIIRFATISQSNMNNANDVSIIGDYKLSSRVMIETIKDMDELSKNLNTYLNSKDTIIQNEYDHIRELLLSNIIIINEVYEQNDDLVKITKLELVKEKLELLDPLKNKRVDELIRDNKINTKVATSLINDYTFAKHIIKKLVRATSIISVEDKELNELGADNETV